MAHARTRAGDQGAAGGTSRSAGRPGGADRRLDRAGDGGREQRDDLGQVVRGAVGPPVEERGAEPTDRPSRAPAPVRLARRGRRDEDGAGRQPAAGCERTAPARRREAFVRSRRLELAQRAHLRGRRQQPGSLARASLTSSGVGSEPKRSSRRSTRLTCACASGVSSQTQRTGTPCARRAVDDVAPRRASQVRVVEDDAASAGDSASSSASASSRSEPPRSSG